MDCVMCDGATVAAVRPKALERDGRLVVVRDVPVEICESCGEVYLDAGVLEQLDVLVRKMLNSPVDQAVGHYTPAA